MNKTVTKRIFLADLHQQIATNCETVVNTFSPLSDQELGWQPASGGKVEWSILQCFDHLNLTHDYYMEKLRDRLVNAPRAPKDDFYKASFWGGIYLYFSLNPKFSFPSPEPITPVAQPQRQVLSQYLAHQETLLQWLEDVASSDLVKTMVPIEKFVRFNLGDCLKILVYHDALHIGQAQRVYAQFDNVAQPKVALSR